ncbi:uncharacterized protein METZ01_LOCUS491303, partial [marine metagenome]
MRLPSSFFPNEIFSTQPNFRAKY